MMLGVLLARAGVPVIVLEKHADFLRDFRGDTVHPSTLELMHELGVLDDFLKLPHSELREIGGAIDGLEITLADLTHLPVHCRFIAMVPQWDLLNFLAGFARRYSTFTLMMRADVVDVIERDGRIVGVRVQTADGLEDIHADLVVGADGRSSIVRTRAGLPIEELGAPIDALWMRLSKKSGDDAVAAFGNVRRGRVFVMFDRGDYWQCAYVIAKGGFDELKRAGLEAFRAGIVEVVPFLADRVGEIGTWDDVKLLTVKVDRLTRWHRAGLLCIGDAAHAMSPVGGVGINLAIQDAVAAANLLYGALRQGTPGDAQLAAVQKRRMFPTQVTQAIQVAVQEQVLSRTLKGERSLALSLVIWLTRHLPIVRRIPARLVGMGVRPEHIRSPEI
jgi:2-polyprenyl-6-methoxyphenol hydroxylase-like FAD-dependent oxidoreductase